MESIGRFAPATVWRAFLFFTAFLVGAEVTRAAVSSGPLPELAQVGKPSPEEAAKLIEQFRNSGIPGDYYLEFELRGMPVRGEGATVKGRWWGSRNEQGAISRIEITDVARKARQF